MSEHMEKIVLCKGVSRENESQIPYKIVLEAAGYECEILPALKFEYINSEKLLDCLINYDRYSGLIFTSQRSVEAIDLVKNNKLISLNNWANLPAFCIGPATANMVREKLNLQNILGEESGNAENLGNFIVKNSATGNVPLLYPCSEIARESIDKILSENKICFEKLVVYQTLPSRSLETDFERIVEPAVRVLVFFSPSVVEHVIPLLMRHKSWLENIKLVAIGQVTNEALNKLGLKVAAVSVKPTPEALLNAIQYCHDR